MKKSFIAIATLLLSTSALAADHLTVFVSDVSYETHRWGAFQLGSDGSTYLPIVKKKGEWTGGAGLAFSHEWDAHWSTEGSVMYDQRYLDGLRFITLTPSNPPQVAPATVRERTSTTPLDLMMRYHFPNGSRWQPYVAAGAHYTNAPDLTVAVLPSGLDPNAPAPVTVRRYDSRLSAQVGVGTTLRITPRTALQFDLRRLVRSEGAPFDPLTRLSFGVNWRL